MLNSISAQYICKNTKNIQKSDFMDGFCLQGELDLTLFYKIEGYFDNLKSLMTENDRTLWGLKMIMTLHDRILGRNKKNDRSPHIEMSGRFSFLWLSQLIIIR